MSSKGITQSTTIFRGTKDATQAMIEFVSKANKKIDSVVDSTAPSVIIDVEAIRKEIFTALEKRGVKFRYVINITKDNISHCKEMTKFAELRHLDGVKGNFEVADEQEYVATYSLQKAKSISQLIYSNINEVAEQQQYVFDTFWNKAISAEERIKQIEEGIEPEVTEIIRNPQDAEQREWTLLRSAKEEIQIIYSTVNSYHIQERDGVLGFLSELAKEGIKIRMLTPIDSTNIESVNNLKKQQEQGQGQTIDICSIESTLGIKIKALVVDKKYCLIMEVRHDLEEIFTASIGLSSYSNSKPTVMSYVSFFEILSRQSELQEQLRQADQMKTEFVNIAAHELRTPIMPIIGGLEMIEARLPSCKDPEEIREDLDMISRNASRLQNLSEDILQVSRIESGNFIMHTEQNVNIDSLILDVIKDIEEKYDYIGKFNRVSISFITPNQSNNETLLLQQQKGNDKIQSLFVRCDPIKISQVLFNLIDNAMKFTEEGKIIVSYKIGSTESAKNSSSSNSYNYDNNPNYVIISIKDQGIGVDPSIKERLFEKFVMKSEKGAGLGLYLSRKIVEAHGGAIWIEENDYNSSDDDRKGATFTFSLPISQEKSK
jgi:two-component system sensor histidine kinase VicK